MRLFISFSLNSSLLNEAQNCQQRLLSLLAPNAAGTLRLTKVERMHVTLKFLGDVSPELLKPIKAKLQGCAENATSFSLALAPAGCFPLRGAPRLVWLGINSARHTSTGLYALQNEIEARISPLGFPAEFPNYKPHLTINYLKSKSHGAEIRKAAEALIPKALSQTVQSFELQQSFLEGKTPRHEVLERFELN